MGYNKWTGRKRASLPGAVLLGLFSLLGVASQHIRGLLRNLQAMSKGKAQTSPKTERKTQNFLPGIPG